MTLTVPHPEFAVAGQMTMGPGGSAGQHAWRVDPAAGQQDGQRTRADGRLNTVQRDAGLGYTVGFVAGMIFKSIFKLMWLVLLVALWLCWALVALTLALVASLTGNERASRQWMRSMSWQRASRI